MIKRFTDLAANERTYLAWIRTAIGLMAFGFLIEKFDLFFRMISEALNAPIHLALSSAAEIIGIVMMIVSILVVIGASARYIYARKNILADEECQYGARKLDLALAGLLIIVALFLVAYIWVSIIN
jgi:putative membrane protein